jgi:hypothetical protein
MITASIFILVGTIIHACGAPPEPETKTVPKVKIVTLDTELQEVKQVKRETDCIRVFLKDMTLQQQAPVEGWEQPTFEKYEETGCKKTMRPLR